MAKTFQEALDEIAAPRRGAVSRTPPISDLSAPRPHCGSVGTFVGFSALAAGSKTVAIGRIANGERDAERATILQCTCPSSTCRRVVIISSEVICENNASFQNKLKLLWPPEFRPSKAPAILEPEAAVDYDEARMVLTYSPAAAAALARRCLQHTIRTKLNIREENLFAEIKAAILRNELSSPTKSSLDHIRKIGNWAAHPCVDQSDVLIRVEREEAEYTIDVLELLFRDLYESPEHAAAMEARLQSRKPAR